MSHMYLYVCVMSEYNYVTVARLMLTWAHLRMRDSLHRQNEASPIMNNH